MTESPDFLRNRDFFRTFFSNNLLAAFSDPSPDLDGFAGFENVTDSVSALPASVLSLSDVALAACSTLWHKIRLLCNGKPYRKRQRKATEKRNRYQKVIICPSGLCCRIFVYGGAIFALPESRGRTKSWTPIMG